jgi:hypothetical protein
MMFRKAWEVAAEDVLVKATEQADLFRDAADYLSAHDHPRTAELCADIAARRQAMAAELAAGLRANGIYPKTVDPEREALEHLFGTVKSALSPDEADSLLTSRRDADNALREALSAAREVDDMPEPLTRMLERFATSLADDDRRIDDFLSSRHETR